MALKYAISTFKHFVSYQSTLLFFLRLFTNAANEETFSVLRLENLVAGSQFLGCCIQLSFKTNKQTNKLTYSMVQSPS